MKNWILYSIISMCFAGITSVIAKYGMKHISSDLGLAVRTSVVFIFVITNFMVFQNIKEISNLSGRAIAFLALSGVTTSLSWIFYYKAIKIGEVSYVAAIDKGSIIITLFLSLIILGEPMTPRLLLGAAFILAGMLILTLK
ncbi:MAG: EamA family transporter [Cytophaga sp.]|uniref:EamA family transporter n=1 Tax=Cytophaga sp. TaxID=29535 RepID=UPI003F7FE1AE